VLPSARQPALSLLRTALTASDAQAYQGPDGADQHDDAAVQGGGAVFVKQLDVAIAAADSAV